MTIEYRVWQDNPNYHMRPTPILVTTDREGAFGRQRYLDRVGGGGRVTKIEQREVGPWSEVPAASSVGT